MRIIVSSYVLPIVLMCTSLGNVALAQDSAAYHREESARIDSLSIVQQRKDSHNLSDLRAEKTDTKAKAREAQRVEREANDAARESRMAYRSEQKAQKARKSADKQARKAARARAVSNEN